MSDRAELEKHLLKVEMENELLKIRLAALEAVLHRISLGSQDSGTTKESLGYEARRALGDKQ